MANNLIISSVGLRIYQQIQKFITIIFEFHHSNNMSSLRKSQSPHLTSTVRQQKLLRSPSLTQDQYQQIKQAFQLFDPHSSSMITYHELKIIMRALGFEVKKTQVVRLAKQYDLQQKGKITFQDYLQIMSNKYAQRDPIQETLKAFRLFDTQNKGKISLNDLRKVAKQLGQTLRQEQLIAMIQQFDRDGDGQIDEEEFLAIIKPSIV